MSDEPRDEDPIVSWSISPILREGSERLQRVRADIRDAIHEAAEAVNRVASPLRVGTAVEDAPEEASEVNTIIGIAGEDLEAGDAVTLEQSARARAAASVYRTRTFEQTHGYPGSMAMQYGSMAYMPGDIARNYIGGRPYQYTERFPKEVTDKAWKLLEQYMTPEQYFAFIEKADIELENVAGDFRLIINRSGKFTILEGARGKGIVAQSGNVRSYKYPLGDEIAAFIDWFNHRTKELIAQWGCGTYGIVKEGEGR